MRKTTLGQLLINQALPEDLRDENRVLDKKGLFALLDKVAEQHPDKYREVSKKLADIGREAAFTTGSHSFGLKHIRQSMAGRKMRQELGAELERIYENPDLDDKAREEQILLTVGKRQRTLSDEVLQEALDTDNPLGRQLKGAGRGNKFGLSSLLGGDLLYTDHSGKIVPIPVLRSYGMGLKPHEYFAGSFGARKGIIDLKTATQDAGFFAKQLVQAAHRLLVSQYDDENPYDDTNPRGMPVDTSDPDNEGAFLAHPVGGYARNVELTPKILSDLREKGHDRILVRSPLVGGPRDGGVYARDLGRRERGEVSPVGDYVGIAAAQALAEPVTQAQISSKHTGGIAGAAGAGAISGFKAINQLVQVPKVFRGGASHSQVDGRVSAIREAPQGGHFVTIEGQEHYVGRGFGVLVKPGDNVEAGDVLSEGVPNPSEIVKFKGIGEGRDYFVRAFRKALKDSGVNGHRRNMELLSRGLINHVRLTDEMGDWSPDDVVPYHAIESEWKPRPGNYTASPTSAVGRYLEKPILHYTVGTRLQRSMLDNLQKFGVKNVVVHNDPPPFEPEMIRGMANVAHDPDWMVRMLGSYQQRSLLEATHRGGESDEGGTSYVPAIASGNLGKVGPTGGWHSGSQTIKPPQPAERSRVIDLGPPKVPKL